jgi:hypothetical protein
MWQHTKIKNMCKLKITGTDGTKNGRSASALHESGTGKKEK